MRDRSIFFPISVNTHFKAIVGLLPRVSVLGITALLFLFSSQKAQAQLSGYSFRKAVTIDYNRISGSGNLSNFPLLISLTDNDLRTTTNGGNVQNANGYDIAFTAADGVTQLDHEIEKYVATTGEFQAWVRIPTLSGTVDTDIYIYYGNHDVSTDPSATSTWNSNYEGVWHLDEEVGGTGTSDLYQDGSGNGNHGDDQTSSTGNSGVVNEGQEFNGSPDHINAGNGASLNITSAITLEAWVYMPSVPAKGDWFNVLGKQQYCMYVYRPWSLFPTNTVLGALMIIDGTTREIDELGSVALSANTWTHLAITYDGTTIRGYVNGTADGTYGDAGSINDSSGDPFYIGRYPGETENMDGYLDEVRVSSVARSADWIKTGVDNQNNPSSFYTVSSQEVVIAPGGIGTNLSLWLKADQGVTGTTSVTQWDDFSGDTRHATATAGPDYTVNDLNFHPTLTFNGTSEFMRTPNSMPAITNQFSGFVVIQKSSTATAKNVIAYQNASWGQLWSYGETAGSNNFTIYSSSPASWNWNYDGTYGIDTDPHVLSADWITSGNLTYNVDGTASGSYTESSSNTDLPINSRMIIGARGVTGSEVSFNEFFDGEIAEVIYYDASLSAANQEKVRSYLGVKYGLTLQHNYVASNGSEIWNSTTNTTYHYDVAGIGRDDDSGLDQQKSISSNADAMVIMDKGGSFSNDLDFILWGNDNGSVSLNGSGSSQEYHNILQRTWKAAVTGSPGTVTVRMIYGNSGVLEDYALHVDGDGDFSDDNSTNYVPSSVSGDTLTFENVTIADGNFFSLGVNRATSPGYIVEGLSVWLKSDAGTGSIATSWEDQSAYGRDYATVTGPTVVSNSDNFYPMVEILSGGFDAPAGSELGTDWSLFFVSRQLASDTDGRVFEGHSGNYLWGYWGTFRNSIYINSNPANYNSGIAVTTEKEDLHMFSYTRDSGSGAIDAHTDGLRLSTFAGTNSASGTRIDIMQGTYTSGGEHSDARIGEMVIYNRALSESDRQKVESYLALKYGLVLDSDTDGNTTAFEAPNGEGINEGDYIASDGTVLWDASAHSAYHNDVAGIGQDDDSGLYQQKSISSSDDAMVIMDNGGSFGEFDFILWGNDNGATTLTTTDKHPSYHRRLVREWKVDANGSPGPVDVRIIFTNPPDGILEQVLHVDGDGTFAAGTTDYAVTSVSGDTLTFENVTFADGNYFTLGFNIESPGSVGDDLVLWLKGDAGTSTTTDGGGLSSWADLSTNGNDVSQGTGGNQPLFRNNTTNNINYNPVIDFDGTDDYMQDASGILGTGTYTDFNLYAVKVTDVVKDQFLFLETNTTQRISAHIPWSDGTFYWDPGGYDGVYRLQNAWGGTTGVAHLWSGLSSTTSGQTIASISQAIQRDGLTLNSDNDAGSFTGNNSTFYLGNNGAGTNYMDGKIAEMVMYTGPISATEHSQIQSYLAIKYGITLDNAFGNYLSSTGSTIWDATTNSGYHNDVTGIGRDDGSGLDQRKSISNSSDAMVIMDKGGSFGSDLSFIVWGNDNGATTTTTSGTHPNFLNILQRKWKAAVTGTPGNVTVRVIYSNTGVEEDYGLHVDGDGDFTSGATNYPVSSISGDTLTFSNVSLANGDFFTIGEGLVSPGGVITNIRLWLKADIGVTGAPTVTSWQDQTSNGWIFNAFGNPQSTSTINGNAAIDFDASGDYLQAASSSVMSGQTHTIFVIAEPDDLSTERALIGAMSGFIGNVLFNSTTGVLLAHHSFNDLFVGGVTMTEGAPSINAFRYGSGGLDNISMVNGQSFVDNTASGPNHGLQPINIGADPFSTNGISLFDGRIAEVVMYETELTDAQISQVQSYLALRYGITLDNGGGGTSGDYLASDGSTMWDADNGAAFHNDVILIGKDDNSGLHQKQSHTLDDSLQVYIDALAVDNASNTGTVTNNRSFIAVGHNGDRQMGRTDDVPTGIYSRFRRVWKVTNTNFSDDFSMEFEWEELGPFDISDIRFLVDDDGTFSNATVFQHGDNGLSITSGSIIVGGISTTHIPANQTRYVTIASTSASTTLPVELLDFSATANEVERTVELSWSTVTETNNDFFTVEKSLNTDEWTEALFIPGAGNSTTRIDYEVVDGNPFPGLSYYRLKQTDFDGSYTYSNILSVTLGDSQEPLTLYPNPAQDVIVLQGNPEEFHSLRLINALGQDITTNLEQIKRGHNSISLDISSLPHGLYVIQTAKSSLKLIKE